ncbi:hypothetical protein PAHAL_5G359200 [Panicum hallii]|uniref:Ubiquitin-like protease family profile domain-containing protein n=1 Tax=Panicum hallii TaxID=206008 RepID=A0A2T8IMA8_9POAL|nr:hypothetical protein PAHAL_5G359200 [Panicum hallii]
MDFIVRDAKYVQRQPLGNDHCEFYVMHFMHVHSGDDMTVANRKLGTSELLLSDILALQEELAGFIMDHVVNPGAEFCLI